MRGAQWLPLHKRAIGLSGCGPHCINCCPNKPSLSGRSQRQRSLLVVVTLPFALTGIVLAFALAVISDAVVAFVLVSFLVAVAVVLVVVLAVFVLLVFVLISMISVISVISVISSNQNFTRLNCLHSKDRRASHQQHCSTANKKVFRHVHPRAETLS